MTTRKFVTILIILVAGFCAIGFCEKTQTQYTRVGTITKVSQNESVVVDTTGNEWVFVNDDFEVGDEVILKMNTNYTDENITDDIIEEIRKK